MKWLVLAERTEASRIVVDADTIEEAKSAVWNGHGERIPDPLAGPGPWRIRVVRPA